MDPIGLDGIGLLDEFECLMNQELKDDGTADIEATRNYVQTLEIDPSDEISKIGFRYTLGTELRIGSICITTNNGSIK